MKALIWILTFFIGTVLNTLLGYAIGIRAGAVLLYIVEYYIAKNLCKKWDERHSQTAEQSRAVSEKQAAEVLEPNINTPDEYSDNNKK